MMTKKLLASREDLCGMQLDEATVNGKLLAEGDMISISNIYKDPIASQYTPVGCTPVVFGFLVDGTDEHGNIKHEAVEYFITPDMVDMEHL